MSIRFTTFYHLCDIGLIPKQYTVFQKTAPFSFLLHVSMPVHAKHDTVLPIQTVCPSVRLFNACSVCVKESTYCHTFMTVWKGHHPSFLSPTIVTKVQGEPSVGGVKCTRVGEFFLQILPFIMKTVRDMPTVTMEH